MIVNAVCGAIIGAGTSACESTCAPVSQCDTQTLIVESIRPLDCAQSAGIADCACEGGNVSVEQACATVTIWANNKPIAMIAAIQARPNRMIDPKPLILSESSQPVTREAYRVSGEPVRQSVRDMLDHVLPR